MPSEAIKTKSILRLKRKANNYYFAKKHFLKIKKKGVNIDKNVLSEE